VKTSTKRKVLEKETSRKEKAQPFFRRKRNNPSSQGEKLFTGKKGPYRWKKRRAWYPPREGLLLSPSPPGRALSPSGVMIGGTIAENSSSERPACLGVSLKKKPSSRRSSKRRPRSGTTDFSFGTRASLKERSRLPVQVQEARQFECKNLPFGKRQRFRGQPA